MAMRTKRNGSWLKLVNGHEPTLLRPSKPSIFSTARPTPWIPPHTRKFHDAPCHKPPKSIVIDRFA